MKLLKTDGIVIKKNDHSEADRNLTLFTRNFGKIDINIRGIRKSKKRHLNGADLFGVSSFVIYKKDEYYVLSSFELIENFYNIRKNLEKLNISYHILEILNDILVENETRLTQYNDLLNSLRFLEKNTCPLKDYLLLSYFLILIIKTEGISFNIEKGKYFHIEDSVISYKKGGYLLNGNQKDIIINLFKGRINNIVELNPTINSIKQLISIFEVYINYHLNLKINFKEFF